MTISQQLQLTWTPLFEPASHSVLARSCTTTPRTGDLSTFSSYLPRTRQGTPWPPVRSFQMQGGAQDEQVTIPKLGKTATTKDYRCSGCREPGSMLILPCNLPGELFCRLVSTRPCGSRSQELREGGRDHGKGWLGIGLFRGRD